MSLVYFCCTDHPFGLVSVSVAGEHGPRRQLWAAKLHLPLVRKTSEMFWISMGLPMETSFKQVVRSKQIPEWCEWKSSSGTGMQLNEEHGCRENLLYNKTLIKLRINSLH